MSAIHGKKSKTGIKKRKKEGKKGGRKEEKRNKQKIVESLAGCWRCHGGEDLRSTIPAVME